jgi:membrane protease YdiL (CAAX protease family)
MAPRSIRIMKDTSHITTREQNRFFVLLECFSLFIGVPALLCIHPPLPILPILWVFAFWCRWKLMRDPDFDRTNLWRVDAMKSVPALMVIRFILCVIILYCLLLSLAPDLLFCLVKEKPVLWFAIIILYPLLSVYPQELIYRTYFFHRYQFLFHKKWTLITVNALLFGYMHIIFHNWIAVSLTVIGGFLFALTYNRSRSTLLVSLEHSLFGCLIFTLGLGKFFYIGGMSTIPQSLRFMSGT